MIIENTILVSFLLGHVIFDDAIKTFNTNFALGVVPGCAAVSDERGKLRTVPRSIVSDDDLWEAPFCEHLLQDRGGHRTV